MLSLRQSAALAAVPKPPLMNPLTVAVLILTLALAVANGANDVSKGVATLAGAGVARYRTAILWGAGTTLVGALASSAISDRLTALFSRGIVTAPPTLPFALAVLVGATAWIGFATLTRVPVSTTHAIVGALIGAGVQLEPGAPIGPNVKPNGWATMAVISTTCVIDSLHSPASSRTRWISPTDCWQTGQVGASSTRSAPSVLSLAATAGADSSTRGAVSAT